MTSFSPLRRARRFTATTTSLALAGFAAGALFMAFSGHGDQAAAQALINHDSNAPVDVSADHSELQSRADRAVIYGNVRISQAGLAMQAQRVTIAYSSGNGLQINRIDATGGVVVTKGGDRASGTSAIYDLDRRIITLIGNVQLIQGANRLSGGRMTIDLASGRATVDGRGAPAAAGTGGTTSEAGRVTGRFTVPERTPTP